MSVSSDSKKFPGSINLAILKVFQPFVRRGFGAWGPHRALENCDT